MNIDAKKISEIHTENIQKTKFLIIHLISKCNWYALKSDQE